MGGKQKGEDMGQVIQIDKARIETGPSPKRSDAPRVTIRQIACIAQTAVLIIPASNFGPTSCLINYLNTNSE